MPSCAGWRWLRACRCRTLSSRVYRHMTPMHWPPRPTLRRGRQGQRRRAYATSARGHCRRWCLRPANTEAAVVIFQGDNGLCVRWHLRAGYLGGVGGFEGVTASNTIRAESLSTNSSRHRPASHNIHLSFLNISARPILPRLGGGFVVLCLQASKFAVQAIDGVLHAASALRPTCAARRACSPHAQQAPLQSPAPVGDHMTAGPSMHSAPHSHAAATRSSSHAGHQPMVRTSLTPPPRSSWRRQMRGRGAKNLARNAMMVFRSSMMMISSIMVLSSLAAPHTAMNGATNTSTTSPRT